MTIYIGTEVIERTFRVVRVNSRGKVLRVVIEGCETDCVDFLINLSTEEMDKGYYMEETTYYKYP